MSGIAHCLMCLWTHVGQKKTFDCSLRRNIGRFRVGCSLHFSYRQSSSPRLSRNLQKKQTSSTMNGNNSNGIADGLKHFQNLDKTKLSSSLSSLRCLTESASAGAGANGLAGTHLTSKRERFARSSDFLNNATQSNISRSWLWTSSNIQWKS